MLATFIDTQRLVYDPVGRPGISRDCKNPLKPDWKILRMARAPPSSWKGKAYDYKEYLKNSVNNEDSDEVEIIGSFESGRVTRKNRGGSVPNYVASEVASEDDSEASPVPKRQKKDSKNKEKIRDKQINAVSAVANNVITAGSAVVSPAPTFSRPISIQVIIKTNIYYV